MEAISAVFRPLDEDEYAKQLKEFQESKAGVKGVVDSGATKVPSLFIHPPQNRPNSKSESNNCQGSCFQVPLIDFEGLSNGNRMEIVNQILEAASTWGFFQIVNHGIPVATTDKLLDGIRNFHEQPQELKQEWYSDDATRKVRFYGSSFLTAQKAAYWKDAIVFRGAQLLEKEQLPLVCGEAVAEYTKCLMRFKETICELLSEALGLSSDWLAKSEVMDSVSVLGHYYPPCPEPELTWGVTSHTDPDFVTLLLQDNIGGLQVLYQHDWVDLPPIHGALILNLGDLMQLMTNDKFKSVHHRVRVVKNSPRTSVAAFFYPPSAKMAEPFGPIKELLSENNRPIYRETTVGEFLHYRKIKGREDSCLPYFKLS